MNEFTYISCVGYVQVMATEKLTYKLHLIIKLKPYKTFLYYFMHGPTFMAQESIPQYRFLGSLNFTNTGSALEFLNNLWELGTE